METLNLLLIFTQTIILFFTVVVAIVGLQDWKAQKKFDLQIDWVKRLAQLPQKFDDILLFAQHPAGYSEEYSERPKDNNESDIETGILNQRYARLTRIQPLAGIINEMHALNVESKIILGEDIEDHIKVYEEIYKEMRFAIYSYFSASDKPSGHFEPVSEERAIKEEKNQQIIYGYGLGKELSEKSKNNTKVLMEKLSKYTFSRSNLVDKIFAKSDEKVSKSRFDEAKERLSENNINQISENEIQPEMKKMKK